MESRSSGESRSYNYGGYGESRRTNYGESRTIASNPTQEKPIQGGQIGALRKQLEDLKAELIIAEQEQALRQQIAETQGQINLIRKPNDTKEGK